MKKSLTAFVALLVFLSPTMLISFSVSPIGIHIEKNNNHTDNKEVYFRIESVDCNSNTPFILFKMFDGCQFVSCYSELDSQKCSYFLTNLDSGSVDFKGLIELTKEKKTVLSSEYLVVILSYFQEILPFTSFESLQVVERFCDRDEPYIVVKNIEGIKYAMLMGNDSLDYPVGSCFYQEFMTLQAQIEGLTAICGIQLTKIRIPALRGKYCVQVTSEKIINKQQYWIVRDLWGNDYAIPSMGHKISFKNQVDLSQSSYWEITYAKVVNKISLNAKLYPVLVLENIVMTKNCINIYQKGKGNPKIIKFSLIRGIYNEVKAVDQNNNRWLIVGDPVVLCSLVENGGCVLAKGEAFEPKDKSLENVFYCNSWQPIDYFNVLGGALNEGQIKEISSQQGSQYEIRLTMFNFTTRNTEQYLITNKTFPIDPQNLKVDDCIRFSHLEKNIYYCEKVECSTQPLPLKKGDLKGFLFVNGFMETPDKRTWYLTLEDCYGVETNLQYVGYNLPLDRRTGGSILTNYGKCTFVAIKGKTLQWWETTDEMCCDSKSKGLLIKPVVTYVTLCENDQAVFKIEVKNLSEEKLIFDVVPNKDSNQFDIVKSVSLEPFKQKTIIISAIINKNERINRFNAEFVIGIEILQKHSFIAVLKNEQECKSCDLEFTQIFEQKNPLCEGDEGVFTLNIRNRLATETVTLSLEGSNKNDALIFEPSTLNILPWETKPVIVKFKQPKKDLLDYANIKMKVITNCFKTFEYSYKSKFNALDICKPCCDFEIQTSEVVAQLCQNQEKIFKFKVSNICEKDKLFFKITPEDNNLPMSIEPETFELEMGQSQEISVKVLHSKSENEMNWQLGIFASCDLKKSASFVTSLKPIEDCDPCYGFSASIEDSKNPELCEGEETNVLVFLENKNKSKTMEAIVKTITNAENPVTTERSVKLQPLTKLSVVMLFKQPKKTNKDYTLVDVSVAYCGKIEIKQLKFTYKSDSICKPCCNFKATLEKAEFLKVKAGSKLKSSITIENLCDSLASYIITGTKDIFISQTKFDLQGKKVQKISLTIIIPNSKTKTLTLPITITSCKNSIKKTLFFKLVY